MGTKAIIYSGCDHLPVNVIAYMLILSWITVCVNDLIIFFFNCGSCLVSIALESMDQNVTILFEL